MHLIKRLAFFKSDNATRKGEHEQCKLIKKFGRQGRRKGQMDHPSGIALTKSGDIVVADSENHRIQVFSQDGIFKYAFGEKGMDPHQLSTPRGLGVTADDRIIVADLDNAAIKIFSMRGKFEEMYDDKERIRMPHGLAITVDGFYVVTDVFLHSVIVLSPLGDVSHTFGSYGDESQQFDRPYHVVTNSNKQIIVADVGNNVIKIFHFKGKLLRCFSQDDFRLPPDFCGYLSGLTCDSDDNTLVSSIGNVYMLTKNGRLWEVLTENDGLTFPRFMVYSTSGRLLLTQGGMGSHNVCIYRYNKDDYRSLNSLGYYAISI